ncbi:MAG: hypothetical protein HQM11_11175 [SAR324 cluster bacterium]|nr:hypothetical protein [SAR324 cluster bacterium]
MNEQELQTRLEKLEYKTTQMEQDGKNRKWFHWPSTIIGIVVGSMLLSVWGYADTPTSISRTDFSSGTVISSSTMNAQFNGVYNAVNQLLSLLQVKSGKVGINNPTPAHTLDVTGTARFTGAVNAAYFPASRNENVTLRTDATNPTYQVTLSADYLTLFNTDNVAYIAPNVSATVDITATGANGLDTGSEAPNIWYYIWAIYNGTTTSGLLSASSTTPTLPSGYTYKKLMGAVRNDGSSNFVPFRQAGNHVSIQGGLNFIANVSNTSITGFSLAERVPSIADAVKFTYTIVTDGSAQSHIYIYILATDSATDYLGSIGPSIAGTSSASLRVSGTATMALDKTNGSHPYAYYKTDATTTKCYIGVSGYSLTLF